MMVIIPIAVAVMAVTLVVLAACLIPTLLEMRKTAVATREFLSMAESELKPVVRDLRETLADIKLLTQGAADKVEDVQIFMEAVGDTGRNLRTINTVMGTVAGLFGSSSVWLTGARVAGRFILERISRKGGKSHGE